jgi:two-component system, cell cycle response regulator
MRILIADADADADATSRLPLEAIVTTLGHECTVVEDGESAWEVLSRGGIDVLLTDWTVAGVNGQGLYQRARNELEDHVYIVLTTDLDHPEHILQGMGAGADDYLVKPLDAFAVQTRLITAARVTELEDKLARARAELERANRAVFEQTLTDHLTGLSNRRAMEDDLARTHARATRVGRTYGIALFDIDHFKLYNDHYGHVAGDEALRRVAATIDVVVRAGECAYRYGGEEFLLLMPDCRPTDSIFITGERIRRAVLETAVPHGARPSAPPFVTLSGGVSCWSPGSPLSPLEVLEEADEALFQAKSDGRNRVYAASSVDGCGEQEPVFTTLGH